MGAHEWVSRIADARQYAPVRVPEWVTFVAGSGGDTLAASRKMHRHGVRGAYSESAAEGRGRWSWR
jgi:hypothetical protein